MWLCMYVPYSLCRKVVVYSDGQAKAWRTFWSSFKILIHVPQNFLQYILAHQSTLCVKRHYVRTKTHCAEIFYKRTIPFHIHITSYIVGEQLLRQGLEWNPLSCFDEIWTFVKKKKNWTIITNFFKETLKLSWKN
jgi:hypothetical protein